MAKGKKQAIRLSEETKKELAEQKSAFKSFLAYEKDKWFFHALEAILLVFTFVMSPMMAYTLAENETPSIINKLYDDLGAGTDESTLIGSVGFYNSVNYYRPNDFPMSGVLKTWEQEETRTFKVYNGRDVTVTDPNTNEKVHYPFLTTTTIRNDEARENLFFPLDDEEGNSWVLASDWTYFTLGMEIGVPKSYADNLISLWEFEDGNYQELLGRNLTINYGQRVTTEEFRIACVFDDKSPVFDWISPYLGTFFISRLELQLYSTPQLVFEIGKGEAGRDDLTRFLNGIKTYFPDSSTISTHRVSFYEFSAEENDYVQNQTMADFLTNMYSCKAPENTFVLFAMPLLFVLAGYLGYAVVTFFDVRGNTEGSDVKNATWHFIIIHLLSLILSLLALMVVKDVALGGAYQVPVFTTTNIFILLGVFSLMVITTILVLTICNFWIKKKAWLTTERNNEGTGSNK